VIESQARGRLERKRLIDECPTMLRSIYEIESYLHWHGLVSKSSHWLRFGLRQSAKIRCSPCSFKLNRRWPWASSKQACSPCQECPQAFMNPCPSSFPMNALGHRRGLARAPVDAFNRLLMPAPPIGFSFCFSSSTFSSLSLASNVAWRYMAITLICPDSA